VNRPKLGRFSKRPYRVLPPFQTFEATSTPCPYVSARFAASAVNPISSLLEIS